MRPTERQATTEVQQKLSRVLLWAVDLGIIAVLFVAPLFMGGRHPVGRLVFVACVCWVAVAWTLRQCFANRATLTLSGREWLVLAGFGVILLQLVPLPRDIIQRLSPAIHQLLPLWSGSSATAQLGDWSHLSLAPAETRGGLVMYLAYAMLFLAIVQRVQSLDDVERLLRWIACAATSMAIIGLTQYLGGNGKFLWIYEHPLRNTTDAAKGTFQNQNHFAHFLALGLGPLLWWWQRIDSRNHDMPGDSDGKNRRSQRSSPRWHTSLSRLGSDARRPGRLSLSRDAATHVVSLAIMMVAFASLLTFSRGGVIAILLVAAVCVGSFVWNGMLNRRVLAGISAIAVIMLIALGIYGYKPLANRLSTLRKARSLEELSHGRQALWEADVQAIRQFVLAGTGVGTHKEVYPIYMEKYYDVEFTHAESGYMHLLLETGGIGLGCMLIGIATTLISSSGLIRAGNPSAQTNRKRACGIAITAGLAASIVHSLGDFVWYIPACMSVTVILVACCFRLRQLNSQADTSLELGRPAWACLAIMASLLGFIMIQDRLPSAQASGDWEKYQKLVRGKLNIPEEMNSPADQVAARLRTLENAVRKNPNDCRANLRLTAAYMEAFELAQETAENPMGLSQIRDAAIASAFTSRENQDKWLSVAVGTNRRFIDAAIQSCHAALRLCPLQGEGYVYLAQLSFLEGPRAIPKEALVAQAIQVRPRKGIVQVAAGKEAALAGKYPEAVAWWKQAFHREPDSQAAVIELVAPQIPAQVFVSNFEPDANGMGKLYKYYRNAQRPDDARLVAREYVRILPKLAQELAEPDAAAAQWREASSVYEFLEDLPASVDCQRRAIEAQPNDFDSRRQYGSLLIRSGRFDEAVENLQWCLRRQAEDSTTLQLLAQAHRERLSAKSFTTGRLPR